MPRLFQPSPAGTRWHFSAYVTCNLLDACVQETFAQTRVRGKKGRRRRRGQQQRNQCQDGSSHGFQYTRIPVTAVAATVTCEPPWGTGAPTPRCKATAMPQRSSIGGETAAPHRARNRHSRVLHPKTACAISSRTDPPRGPPGPMSCPCRSATTGARTCLSPQKPTRRRQRGLKSAMRRAASNRHFEHAAVR